MEFREESKANILYISTLDEARTKEEIKEIWDFEENKPFDSKLFESELTRLIQNRIIKEENNKYRPNFHSQAFTDELKVFLDKRKYDALHQIEEDYLKFLKSDEVQEKVFTPEKIRKYYNRDIEKAKKNPMKLLSEIAEILFIMNTSSEEEYSLESQEYNEELINNLKDTYEKFDKLREE